jgi:hypothetical protein
VPTVLGEMFAKLSTKVLASIAALSTFGAAGAWGTYSSFTDTTSASGSTFSSGTVHITNDASGSTMFTMTGMVPGTTATKCINVTNSGDVPFHDATLAATASGALGAAINVTIDKGTGATGGSSGSCANFNQVTAGFVSGLLNALPSAASPADDPSTWAVAEVRSYRVRVTLDPAAASTFQGKTASLDLTWTASS